MDDFYTDEPIGWRPPDNLDDEGNPIDDEGGTDDNDGSLHSWDYYEPEPDDEPSWQQWSVLRQAPDSPDRIQQLIDMINRQPWQITMTKSFYEQAKFMEDFDDDAPIVPFNEYYPSYRSMTVDQIRSYFTIRKMLRHGQFPDVPVSYIFVYVYETLMQIGVNTPEEGYEILQELVSGYGATEPKLKKYVGEWLKDYVVYNNLSSHFAEMFPAEQKEDEAAAPLENYNATDDKTLVQAVASACKYNLPGGVLIKKKPEEALRGAAAALRAVFPVMEKGFGHSISELLFGKRTSQYVQMFQNAVFYTPNPIIDTEVYISPRHRFVCRGGLWTKDKYFIYGRSRTALFKSILREIDLQIRGFLQVKPYLKPKDNIPVEYNQAIGDAVTDWYIAEKREEAEREAEKRRIKIDFGKLGGIREDAGVVQDKLLDGIELEDDIQPAEIQEPKHEEAKLTEAQQTASGTAEQKEDTAAGSKEKEFLRLFLSGDDWQQYLRDIHVPEGVMVENINNIAMDKIGDIVLEDNGGGLSLIEDYRQDIEEYINDNGQQ